MARESQAYQIAVITLFLTTIILALTTFIFFNDAQEQKKAADEVRGELTVKETANRKCLDEIARLKELMGFDPKLAVDKLPNEDLKKPETIEGHVEADMELYAGGIAEAKHNYHAVLPELRRIIDERNAEIETEQAKYVKLDNDQKAKKAERDAVVTTFDATMQQAKTDVQNVTNTYQAERTRLQADQQNLQTLLDRARKKAADDMAKIETSLTEYASKLQTVIKQNEEKTKKIEEINRGTFDVPDGEIQWVNQREGTVWINLGSADLLRPQMTFSVYPADATNLATAGKKASIEVTLIRGEHLAVARIVEPPDIANPILAGDKIHTPVWSPGEVKRFALAGFLDVDGDGKTDRSLVRSLITMSGGVIDCEIDDNGQRVGKMTIDTRYLVLGTRPDERSGEGSLAGYSGMIDSADQLGVQKISLADLLQQMGYRPTTNVVQYGRGANPDDFRAKPPDGAPRVSSGNVSGLFQPRQPPAPAAPGRGGAY